jgi:hypothetical protein
MPEKKGKIAKALQKAEITKALRGMEVGTFKISRRALQERYNLCGHLAGKLAREFKQANNMTGLLTAFSKSNVEASHQTHAQA